MNNHFHLLQASIDFSDFKFGLLTYVMAFVLTLIFIPPVIFMVKRFKLFDRPNARKEHSVPTPTFGGIAIFAGMMVALLFWFKFNNHPSTITFFLSMVLLFGVGIMDDLKDLAARYKLVIEAGLASLLAVSGIRITSFGGLFGITELHIAAQYIITVVTIVGISNAFNLIDGIDGLAGGLGFMSLVTLGIFLTISKDLNYAMIAFAMAGALLGFLYFNFNPARIFMGDTGSLILGFIIAVLCVQLMKINSIHPIPVVPNIYVFTLGIVMIPVFDTLRVFGIRIWQGRSPFSADKMHIHHLITNKGFTHGFAARIICVFHGFILILVYWMKDWKAELQLIVLFSCMLSLIYFFNRIGLLKKYIHPAAAIPAAQTQPE
ncbi:MAG TPA: MraY family glycosyltransferase [Chitinophagaceae bacterium]|jgi:UDP-N-acetylmuramyl pentapeptide phosphotransferase/UDP-N-acetylglucosamine-1-phosphate transferase|nr:MraY family glycosyltransferase [Chitinophagaceae bacterium]